VTESGVLSTCASNSAFTCSNLVSKSGPPEGFSFPVPSPARENADVIKSLDCI
jgi:hypothetical protein